MGCGEGVSGGCKQRGKPGGINGWEGVNREENGGCKERLAVNREGLNGVLDKTI